MATAPHIGTALAETMVNAAVDTLDASAGSLKVFSGALPAECITADPTGALVTITLPTPAFAAAGSIDANTRGAAKAGTWSATASGAGDAACFRIYNNSAVCIAQGTAAAATADLIFDNITIAIGATITITAFSFNLPINPEG